MKSLSVQEIHLHSEELKSWLDSKVQKIICTETGLGLELSRAQKNITLWFEMSPQNPCLLLFEKLPAFFKLKKSSPIQLFLKAHLMGKRLSEITHAENLGRVLFFEFGYEDVLSLEVRLIPHAANIIAKLGEGHKAKQISFHQVKELEPFSSVSSSEALRGLVEWTQSWVLGNLKKPTKSLDPVEVRAKAVEKKKNVLKKIEDQIEGFKNDHSYALGEWLKVHQTLQVPDEFSKLIDRQKSLAWNIQHVFGLAKKVKEKLEGTLLRKEELLKEISDLEKSSLQNFLPKEKPNHQQIKKDKNWRGYRFPLNDKVEVFVGKNATENLQILRYAQSWDIWMHLKDYPGAHGVIKRPRNLAVSTEELKEVAQFIAAKSKKSAHFLKPGDNFEVLYTECRFVRPIKGDKPGRVTYSDEKVLLCRMK